MSNYRIEQIIASTNSHDSPGQPFNYINDALIRGDSIPPEVWDHPVRIATGYDSPDFNSARVRCSPSTVGKFFMRFLSGHWEGPKQGQYFLSGAVSGRDRRNDAVLHQDAMIFDIDKGMTFDEVGDAIRTKLPGMLFVQATSHSHLKTRSKVAWKRWSAWAGDGVAPDAESVRRYLMEEGHSASVLEAVSVVACGDALPIEVEHGHVQKCRVIFFLRKPWIVDRSKGDRAAEQAWREVYHAAALAAGLPCYDPACGDLARLFYTPRHREGGEFRLEVTSGGLLDLGAITRVPLPNARQFGTTRRNRGTAAHRHHDNAFNIAAADMGATPALQNPWLFDLVCEGQQIQAASFMGHYYDFRGKAYGGRGLSFGCPLEANHTDPDDGTETAFAAVDGTENAGQFIASCRHASCAGVDRLLFLDAAVTECEITESAFRAEYVIPRPIGNMAAEILQRWGVAR